MYRGRCSRSSARAAHGRDGRFAQCRRAHGALLPQRQAGFTLLEVLVALVVLAVALVALTRTASHETEAFDSLRQRSLAGWVAANTLTEVRLAPGLPPIGRSDGTTRMAGRQWSWRLDVKPTPSAGIRRLHVAVYAPGVDPDQGVAPVWTMDGFDSKQLASQ